MAICNLTPEKQLRLIGNIILRLEKFKKDKATDPATGALIPFDLKSFIENFYNDILTRSNSASQAAGLTQLVPGAIDASFTHMSLQGKRALMNHLTSNGLSRDEVIKLTEEFESDIKNVGAYLQKEDPTLVAAAEANLTTHPKPKPTRGRPTNEARTMRQILSQLQDDLSDDSGFNAKVLNSNSTTGQEAEEGVKDKSGRIVYTNRKNPLKVPYYNTLKTILNAMQSAGLQNGETLTYDGHTGFKLAASVNDKGEKILTITDNEGVPINFNDNGTINREAGGQEMFYTLRVVDDPDNKDIIDDVTGHFEKRLSSKGVTGDAFTEAVDAFRKEFTEERARQRSVTDTILDTLNKNPGKQVLLDITGGSKGFIQKNFTNLNNIWDTLSQEEQNSIRRNDLGRHYITIANVEQPIELRAQKILNNAELTSSIIKVLTQDVTLVGKPLSNQAKVNYVEQFIYTGLDISTDNNDNLVLVINGKVIDLKSKDAVKTLGVAFQSLYLQVNDSLLKNKTYDFFDVQEDGTIKEPVSRSYVENLLMPYLQINAVPNADGKIEALNGYFTWNAPNDIVEAMEPAVKENTETTEIAKKAENNYPDLLMSNLIADKGTPGQVIEAMRWWKNSPLSKHIKLEVLTNIANSNAWATWNVSGITLFEGSDYTHAYHEAWHAFSQLYLSKDEKSKLYNEASKQAGTFSVAVRRNDLNGNPVDAMESVAFKDATPRQLEEYIAEEFRKFAMSSGKSKVTSPVRKNIFQKIWDYLKTLFTGVKAVDVITQPDSVNALSEIFNKLYVGNINNYSPNVENVLFDSANAGIVAPGTLSEGLSYAESKLITNSIDGLVSEYVTGYAVEKKTGHATTRIFGFRDNRNAVFNRVKTQMIQRLDELTSEFTANQDKWDDQTKQLKDRQIYILKFATDHWGDPNDMKDDTNTMGFYKDHSEFADQMKTPLLKEDGSPDIDSTNEEDIKKGLRGNDRKNNELSSLELADSLTLYLIRSLIEVDPIKKDALGNPVSIKNELGFPKLASFPNTWNGLVRNISGASSIPELYSRLLEKSQKGFPIYTQILQKLGDMPVSDRDSTAPESRMWIKFWQDFNKPRIPLIAFIVNKDHKGVMTYKVGRASAEYFKTIRKWGSDFISNPGTGRYITKSANKDDKGTNYLNLKEVVQDFIRERELKVGKDKVEIKYEIRPGKQFDFFKAIGINLTDNQAIRDEIAKNPDVVSQFVNYIALANNAGIKVSDITKFFSEGFIGKKFFTTREGLLLDVPNIAGRLKELSEIETENSDEYSSLSRTTPDGNRQYEQALNSTMTVRTDALNKAKNFQELVTHPLWQHMQYLDFKNNPAARSSKILNSLFVLDVDPATDKSWGSRRSGTVVGENNTLDIFNLSGSMVIESDYSDHGVAHSGMTGVDKFITDFHSLLSAGYAEQARHGSKSSAFSTKAARYNTYAGKKQNHLYIDTADFLPSPGTDRVKGVEEAFKIIKGYIQSEIERIQIVKKDPEYYKKIKGFKKADQFTLFDNNILSSQMKKDLLSPEFIAAIRASQIPGMLNHDTLTPALAKFPELATQLETDFKNYFKRLIGDYKTNMLVATQVKEGDKVLYDGIQPKVYEDIMTSLGYSQNQIAETLKRTPATEVHPGGEYVHAAEIARLKEAALRSFAFNAWIHKVEMMTVYYGDAVQYNHEKDEFNKRNSTFGSAGYIFATDNAAIQYINSTKNAKGEVNHMRAYGETVNAPIRPFDGTFNTAIIKDNEFRSPSFNTLRDMFTTHLKSTGLKASEIKEALYGKGGSEDDVKGGLMKPYNKVNEGDGQGWVSFDAYKILKELEGKWSPAQDKAYNDTIAGKVLSAAEIAELFPVYKVQYAGTLKTDKGRLPVTSIHKFSLFPLIPTVIKDTPMDTLHKEMIAQKIDYSLFESGSKLSSITSNDKGEADSIFEGNDTAALKKDIKFTPNVIFLKYLKNQLDLNNNFKGKTIFSTQLRKLITSGLMENGVPVDYKGGKVAWDNLKTEGEKSTASPMYKLARNFEKRMARIVQLNLEKLVSDVGWTWNSKDTKTRKPVGDMIPMVKFIREELAKQGFAKHEIDFVDVNAQGELVRDLSTSFSAPKIERLLMAIVNNRIVKQNMTGEALVQVSVAFTQNTKFQKPTEKQNELYGASGLPFYQPDPKNPTKACKVKIALQGSFENLFNTVYIKDSKVDGVIAVYDTVDGKRTLNFDKSLARLNEMVKNDQWLDQDNNRKKITLAGVRIPVQGLNSMEFMEVYEFLPPIAGPIIILPSEIVAKSGGDFDVDKLTTYFPHITRAGTWINSDLFPGDNWKEEIDKKMAAVDAKIYKLFGQELGEADTLNNIKKKLKGDLKSHSAAIKVLKFKREAEYAKNKTYLDIIKEEFDTLGKRSALQEDFKKLLAENDDEGLLKRLEAYDAIGALKTKGDVIYNAYQQIKKSEIKELDALIDQEYVDKKVLVDIKLSPEFQNLLNEYTDLQDQRKNFTKSIQNSLLNDIVSILSLNHNAVPLLTANDTHLTQPISEQMESKVQSFNFKASRMAGEIGVSKGVSPSRILEEDFNLKKHQDNIMGMGSLGIVAIDNAYNPIFNSAGAYIEPEYTLPNPKLDPKTGESEFIKVPTKVYLNHNEITVDKDGKKVSVISLSNLKDKAGKNSIAEIDSQLVNGFVDVEKNAWVAFIQGNKENTPMLLFLNKIGVPFEEAVTFVSNPIIRKYIEEQKKRKGALGDLVGIPYDKSGVKRRAKEAVWTMLGHGGKFPAAKVRFEMMEKALNEGKDLTLANMSSLVNAGTVNALKGNKLAEGAFLHYIYLEELMSGYNDLKSKTNVDTKKTGSLFDAQLRVQAVDELYKSANMPKRIIDYIENESSISGFFVQQFAHDLWSPLFKLRSNSVIDKYLTDILSNYARKTAIENKTGYSPERMVSEFKNDFMSYLFINQIKSFEIGSSTYKGIRVNDSPVKQIAKGVPVKYAEGINKAAYVKEVNGRPNLFVNIKNIRKEFYNKSYLDTAKDPNNYIAQGLAPVDVAAFNNSETGQKEYQNFVMEREYLRNSFPISSISTNTAFTNEYNKLDSTIQQLEGESQVDYENRIHKMAYENFLRDKALDNTFNFYQLFKSGDKSYPKRMMELIDKYPHLTDKYSVLKQFAIRGRKKGTDFDADHLNLLLKDARDLDKDSMTQYYDDITALSTSKSLVLGDSKEIAEENNFINDFFKRLSLFAFQQSGMSAGTETAFTSILPYEDYSKIITEAAAKVEKQLTWKKLTPAEEASYKKSKMFITRSDKGVTYGANVGILNQFLDQFEVNNSTENKSGRVTGKDWTKKLTPEFLKGDTADLQSLPMSPFIHQTAKPGVFILSREGVTEEGVKVAINNQAIMQLATANADNAYFVFNDSIVRAGLTSEESKNYLELYYQNRPMMFAHPTFGVGMGKGIKTYTGAEGRFKAGTELSFTDPKDLDALKALIDQDIAELEALYKSGKKLVFVENGYAQDLRKQSQVNAPETTLTPGKVIPNPKLNAAPKSEFFVYLSQQLSEKFGYVNPGSEREVSIMEILSQTQIITQQDIDERERTCK